MCVANAFQRTLRRSLDYYRNLRVTSPSKLSLFLRFFGDYQVIGAGPEFGFSEKWRIGNQSDCWNSPSCCGTNEAEDAALADELSHDVKETAEHRMLVDLRT